MLEIPCVQEQESLQAFRETPQMPVVPEELAGRQEILLPFQNPECVKCLRQHSRHSFCPADRVEEISCP